MHGHGQTIRTKSSVCPRLLKQTQLDRISAHRKLSFRQRIKDDGLPRLISDLINPLFIPPLVIGITTWLLGGHATTISWITGLALLFYTLIPLAATFYFVQTNKIISIDLPERKSRDKLFILSTATAGISFLCFFFMVSAMHQLIPIIALVFVINTIFGFGINTMWKMSIHSAALSSAGTIFLYLSQFNFLLPASGVHILSLTILLVLLPLMIWARYCLNIHTLAELFGGAVSGFLLTILQLSILTNIW